jgi:SAM-dependent methyltransferase
LQREIHPPTNSPPPDSERSRLVAFYERSYTTEQPADADRYARWRALGAVAKADHVVALCTRAGVAPASTLDVGCGDGALLSELARRGFGGRLTGVEIAPAAVAIARRRDGIESVELYDGRTLALPDGARELGVLSHVLEHVVAPAALLAEVARVCRAVVVEVPLEANLSARRASKRRGGAEVGHLQLLDRRAVRSTAQRAGLRIAGELTDALSLQAQRFFAQTPRERALAGAKWTTRAGLHRASPALARRLFTVHYACLCVSPHGAPVLR